MRGRALYLLVGLGLAVLAVAPWLVFGPGEWSPPDGAGAADVAARASGDEPIQPIPREVKLDARKVALGARLFNDPRLSRDDSVSCARCHNLAAGGVDHLVRAVGIEGRVGEVNTPTVFNSGLNFRQFWDGRAETLEDQIDGPVQNPKEMGSTWPDVVRKLQADPSYPGAFAELYPARIQRATIKDAIATFERSLITPDSRFDRFLRGDRAAITADEVAGYQLFKAYGCVACHQGINVGGNMFQTFGIVADYFADRGHPTRADLGRFNVTGKEYDRHTFKVPSLRNVVRTAPYFHDGSAKTLPEAVAIMAKYQLGRTLSTREVDLIVQFLGTLTGEYTGKPL